LISPHLAATARNITIVLALKSAMTVNRHMAPKRLNYNVSADGGGTVKTIREGAAARVIA
jgi:hypothetical protein